jgi:hypothetical protein
MSFLVNANDFREVRERYAPWAPDTTDALKQECIVRCLEPTGSREDGSMTGTHYFMHMFFPESIKKAMTPQRLEYLRLLDNDEIPNLYFITHRGFAKTTFGIFFCVRSLACRFQKYILYTSAIYKVAAKRTEAIRSAIVSPQVREVFGNMEPKRGDQIGAQFAEEAFMLVDPDNRQGFAFVEPKGAEQVCNGSLVMLGNEMVRPTLILSDDGQKRLHIQNDTVREQYEDWWVSEVEPTVEADAEPNPKTRMWHRDPGDGLWRPPYRRMVFDTCKHPLAHIMKLQSNPDWHGMTCPIGVEEGDNIKINHKIMTQRALDARVRRFRLTGKMDEFYREYMCRPAANENRIWNESMFQRIKKNQRFDDAFKFIVVDPARSTNKGSAFTSILVVAVVPSKGIFLRRNLNAKMEPDDYYRATFELAREYQTSLILVEETGLAMVVKNAFHQAASIAGLAGHVQLDWLKSVRSPGVEYGVGQDAIKKARMMAMYPFYKQGLVFHSDDMRGQLLERTYLAGPDGATFWDATDAAGYIPEIMERYEVYLDPVEAKQQEGWDEIDTEYAKAGEYFKSGAWLS